MTCLYSLPIPPHHSFCLFFSISSLFPLPSSTTHRPGRERSRRSIRRSAALCCLLTRRPSPATSKSLSRLLPPSPAPTSPFLSTSQTLIVTNLHTSSHSHSLDHSSRQDETRRDMASDPISRVCVCVCGWAFAHFTLSLFSPHPSHNSRLRLPSTAVTATTTTATSSTSCRSPRSCSSTSRSHPARSATLHNIDRLRQSA